MTTINTLRNKDFSSSGFQVKTFEPEMIKELRKRNGVSQALLAKYMNTSISTIRQWEIGYRQPSGPSLKLLSVIDRYGIEMLE